MACYLAKLRILLLLVCSKWASCSSDDGAPRIVNGDLVAPGEAKYHLALLRSGGAYICGAAVLTRRLAITAGHCVAGNDLQASRFLVRYGTLDQTLGPNVTVQRVILHPAFTRASFHYDAALLFLQESLVLDEKTGEIALATDEPEDGSHFQVTGWGQIEANGPTSQWLLKATLGKMNHGECQERWRDGGTQVTGSMFCGSSAHQSACIGDSGSPVTQGGKLVGLVSWGSKRCLDDARANVFTNLVLPEVRDWIEVNWI